MQGSTSSSGRLTPALAGAVVLLLAALGCGLAEWRLGSSARAQVAIASTHILQIEALMSALKDVETGQRGYVLVGDEGYLDPYEAGRAQAAAALDALEETSRGEVAWPLGNLRATAQAKLDWTARSVSLRREQGRDAAVRMIETFDGKRLMDAVRAEVARVQEMTRVQRDGLAAWADRRSIWLTSASLGLGFAACVLLALYARRQRKAEQRATALLGVVMDNSPVGLGLLDPSLRLRQGNTALSMLGDMPGGTLPAAVRAAIAPHAALVLGGGSIADIGLTLDHKMAGQQQYLELSLFPVRGAGAGTAGIGLVASDVSNRHSMAKSLRRSEEQLRMIVDSVPQLAWMTDPSGEIEWYNKQWYAFTGETPETMLGSGWQSVHHPDHMEVATRNFRAAIDAGTAWEDTFPLRRADGQYRWFLSRALPLRDRPDEWFRDGRLIGWFGTNTDVTEMREAEESLTRAKAAAEEANTAKSQFLANMSHELRTPLSAVIGYSEMLEEEAAELEGAETFREDLSKINSNARHLLSLINDVLDLSKIEAGHMDVQLETFDTPALLREVASTVDALISRKSNELAVEIGPGLEEMHSDPVKLRQCLFNLLGNAAKFTESGRITLRGSSPKPGWASFEVEDTGIGMTAEQLDRLFQRFSQADSSTTRRFGGTGLGLALTRAFVTLLGGEITVRSQPGQGTCFTIELPLDMRAPAAPVADEPPEVTPGEAGAGLVLVIDDDAATRDLLNRFLRREGFAVRLASDGRTGLEMARRLRPATILLDVMMPGLDGWSVLTALKSDEGLAGIPVVMVTMVQERGLAFSLGAAEYMTKPLDWSRLKRVLEQHRAQTAPGVALVVALVIGRDGGERLTLRPLLEREGWAVADAEGTQAAMARMEVEPTPALVLLDLGEGDDGEGLRFVQALRSRPEWRSLPVIVLTDGGVDPAELERLRTVVHEVGLDEDGVPAALIDELRRIASVAARPVAQPEGTL